MDRLLRTMRDDGVVTPFDTLESAHEYVALLREGIVESRNTLDQDLQQASREGATRRRDALQLITYKLDRLQHHIELSQRLLKDLRILRRLLLGERLPDVGRVQ